MFQLALDGPGGAGKSTVARAVAQRENLHYVDTGAIYRSLGYALLKSGVNILNEEEVKQALPSFDVEVSYTEDGTQQVLVNGVDRMPFIRTQEAADAASRTSAISEVRAKLLDAQQSLAKRFDVVMDGRDIGTVILPCADLKIFLTASAEVRAKRRYEELIEKGQKPESLNAVLLEMKERDQRDSKRAIAPLKQADDAVLLDTSDMSLDQVIQTVCDMVKKCR